jgi:archaellum component FlaD/FlaE
MNFDADRLSRLSGLGPIENTGVLTETKEESVGATLNEGCCGCSDPAHDHGSEMMEPQPRYMDQNGQLFEIADDEEDVVAESGEITETDNEEEAPEEVEKSAPLTMETLRDTVLELRNEILAEQAEEQQALTEAPARAAIRKEIKALLAEMPTDAATNWMYGKKGKPSSAHNKSRATALAGIGFANSKH